MSSEDGILFSCTLCGKDFEGEFGGIMHVLMVHNVLVCREDAVKDAIPYKEYIKKNSIDVEEVEVNETTTE